MHVDRPQVLAFRAHRLGITQRAPAGDLLTAVRGCGVQDTPPGNADVSLAARLLLDRPTAADAVADKRVVLTWSLRGAPHLVAPTDLATFTLGVLPAPGTREALWRQPEDALDVVEAAMVEALDGPMSKGELSGEVTRRVPAEYAPYCRGCEVHHPSESVFRAAPLLGRIVLTGTAPVVLERAERWLGAAAAGDVVTHRTDLLRRYLHAYAPTTPAHFADWVGIAKADARQRWRRISDELVQVAGGFVLEEDLDDLRNLAQPDAVRLLPAKDAWLQARDRELLFPVKDDRAAVYKTIGGPGVVIAGGEPVGVWRAAVKSRRLTVRWRAFDARSRVDIADEAQRVATVRGLAEAVVVAWE